MKKYLALLLCVIMIFSLISCAAEEPKKEVTKEEETIEEVLEGSGNVSVPRGKLTDTSYTSTYSGITIKLPEQPVWSFTADDELAKQMKIPVGVLQADLGTTLLQGTGLKDMEATNGSYGSEMYVYYEMSPKTAEKFLEDEIKKLDSLAGISFGDETEISTVTLGEKEYLTKIVECESAGTGMTHHYYINKGEDGVITFLHINLFDGDKTDVAALFN